MPPHKGSSPRVWGQVHVESRSKNFNRIIPTRMGTRLCIVQGVITKWDHPHAYGDKLYSPAKQAPAKGSSPRVWGQVAEPIWEKYGLGIIPTRMGTRQA